MSKNWEDCEDLHLNFKDSKYFEPIQEEFKKIDKSKRFKNLILDTQETEL